MPVEVEAIRIFKALPVVKEVAEIEATVLLVLVEATSIPLNWVLAAVKFQKPVTVSFWDKEAGPPEPQSSRTTGSAESLGEAVTVKWAPSKEMVAVLGPN